MWYTPLEGGVRRRGAVDAAPRLHSIRAGHVYGTACRHLLAGSAPGERGKRVKDWETGLFFVCGEKRSNEAARRKGGKVCARSLREYTFSAVNSR
jgi:hypothetical protein